MNIPSLLRLFVRSRSCSLAQDARLGSRARIFNVPGEQARIHIGSHSVIDGDLLVFAHGGHIRIGDWCFVGEGSRIWSGARIDIGHRVLIAHNVSIFDNLTHPMEPTARHAHFRHIVEKGHPAEIDLGDRPVRIEDDVWVGAGCTILRGVTIGRGAILGAASVVVHDIPPMALVAGNPARVIRTLDSASTSTPSPDPKTQQP